jgi:nuclear transport factor 2 (NTF2) superfamily protein
VTVPHDYSAIGKFRTVKISAMLAVRLAYEWHDDSGQWFRSYDNENWEFDEQSDAPADR